MVEDEEPTAEERIDNACTVMSETQPSWGWRIARVWSALGHNYGDGDEIEWAMQRDFFRLFASDPAAVQAMRDGEFDFPPRGKVIR